MSSWRSSRRIWDISQVLRPGLIAKIHRNVPVKRGRAAGSTEFRLLHGLG